MRFAFLALAAVLALAGCEMYTPATPDAIAASRYVSPEPPSVTLMSMVSNRTQGSAHSALLINGSQQVLYDPAGTFTNPDLPRNNDVHYGMTPRYVDYYERYHARFNYFVEAQRVPVSRATADQLIANVQAEGKSMKMTCALAVGEALHPVPPFQNAPVGFFPNALRRYFATLPGVQTSYVRESDVGQNKVWEQAPTQ